MQSLATSWSARPPRFLFASDQRSAQQSAQVLAARFAIEPLADARLREVDLGEWDGRRWDAPTEVCKWIRCWSRRREPV